MPGRSQPPTATWLVAPCQAGLAASASRSVAKACGGRTSSASISPMRGAVASASAVFSARPCPDGPQLVTDSTRSVTPGDARAATSAGESGTHADASHAMHPAAASSTTAS